MTRPRSPGSNLLRWLADAATPVYAIDDQRVILYANAAAGAWLGVDAEQLPGVRCDYRTPVPAEAPDLTFIASALCPPPDALAGSSRSGLLVVRTASGVVSRRAAEFHPLVNSAGETHGVVVVVATVETDEAEILGAPGTEDTPEQLHRRLQAARQAWWGRFQLDRLVGESPAIRRVREQARWAAEGQARSVVVGPPGCGREFVARAIHRGFRPLAAPLTTWDGALLDGELLKRALDTLARIRPEGSAPAAVLIRDVDKLSPAAQDVFANFVALARVPPRTLCTAQRSLPLVAREGGFRRDLAAWLSTCELEIPPLDQRPDDVPLLAQAFLEEWNARGKRQLGGFTADALELLVRHRWPGQTEELARVVLESCQRAEGPYLGATDLPELLRQAADAARPPRRTAETLKLDEFLQDVERELLRRALKQSRGNKAKAARLLGISRPRLLRRLEQLGLEST